MKVLYIDVSLRGHRLNYLKALVDNEWESIVLLPEESDIISCRQFVMTSGYDIRRDILHYCRWIAEIKTLVRVENVDVVHFLCGDALYRFFGMFLNGIPARVVITYHHVLFSKIRNISLKNIFRESEIGIVHTEYLKESLQKIGIQNVKKVEYPVFGDCVQVNSQYAKAKLGLPLDRPCIVVLGGTQRYKGIDILIDALKEVNTPFYLYITGLERDFSQEYIQKQTSGYADSVGYCMRRLSEVEYKLAIAATDYVVLPYRFEFDGASGPMIEGVWNRKFIIGAEHGSMGSIIERYHLGRTFKTENAKDLARVLNEVLGKKEKWSQEAEEFREQLTVDYFIKGYREIYE